MSSYQYLFTPLKVGPVVLPNRIIMGPHHTWLPRGSEQEIAYFETKVKGGAGTVFLQSTRAVRHHRPVEPVLNVYSEEGAAIHAKTVDALHKLGAKVFIETMWFPNMFGSPSVSSTVPAHSATTIMRSLTIEEIKDSVQQYGKSAGYAKKAGFDGMEMYMACGNSLHHFISPMYNKRTDEYGGSQENRLRVVHEILDAIRKEVGSDFAVGLNIDVDEEALGGITLDEGVEICKIFADTGKIDFLRISARNVKAQEGHFHYPSSYLPQGTAVYAAAAVREVVDNIPIIASHHINSAEYAEQLIAEGQCDAVSMCRALIADPELPNKAKNGQEEDIRSCIGCVEGCYQRFTMNIPVGCSVNPDTCVEWKGPVTNAEKSKKVVIVGGGVAGMEAAMIAAQRGHSVTLLEKSDILGGHVNMHTKLPGLSDRAEIVRWLELQLSKEKVDIRLNTEGTVETVKSFSPEAVLVATGSNYSRTGISPDVMFPIPGHELDYVLTPEEVLLEGKEVGQHILVYDTTDYIVGPGLAELFADQGKNVDLVTGTSALALSMASSFVNNVVSMRVLPKVDNYIRETYVTNIEDHEVTLSNKYTLEEDTIKDVDTVILVTSKAPNESLYFELLGKFPEIHLVGDAREARFANWSIDAAIKDGKLFASAL